MTKKKWRSLIFLYIVTETIERSVANMALSFIDYDYDTIVRPLFMVLKEFICKRSKTWQIVMQIF